MSSISVIQERKPSPHTPKSRHQLNNGGETGAVGTNAIIIQKNDYQYLQKNDHQYLKNNYESDSEHNILGLPNVEIHPFTPTNHDNPVLNLSNHHNHGDVFAPDEMVSGINMNDVVSFELTPTDNANEFMSVISSSGFGAKNSADYSDRINFSEEDLHDDNSFQYPSTPPANSSTLSYSTPSNTSSNSSPIPPPPRHSSPSPSSRSRLSSQSPSSMSPEVIEEDTPQGAGTSGSNTATTSLDYITPSSIEGSDSKEGIEELCPVCGDKVSGYHYGLLTCESCKGFFKRTVQNKKVYTCVAERTCQIDKTQRKRCPYCRFQKCLDVGMKLEAVRQDRMRGGRNKFGPMYKRDRARKLQLLRQRQMTHPGLSTLNVPGIHIKEEIQSPFLSSSTSSPDSSPAPMRVLNNQQQAGTASGLNPGSIITTQNNLTLWVGGGGPTDAGGGNSNNNNNQHIGASGAQQTQIRPVNRNILRMPELIPELLNQVDEGDWLNSLMNLLQNQTYNQVEVDLFELMCKVLDQNLFAQVDWARNSVYFKDLRVDDQMKLLQQSWSDMLLLDHLHQRLHNNLQSEISLVNGQKFDLLNLALLGAEQYEQNFNDLLSKMEEMQLDISEYILLKFTMLLATTTSVAAQLTDRSSVEAASESIRQALIEYCMVNQRGANAEERVQKVLSLVPEIHYIADCGEKNLYLKMVHSGSSTQTLLMEMLHTKRR